MCNCNLKSRDNIELSHCFETISNCQNEGGDEVFHTFIPTPHEPRQFISSDRLIM